MELHKDITHVKQLLGHKKIENTMKYTQLVNLEDSEEFTCRVAKTLDGAKELIEGGLRIRHRHGRCQAVSKAEVADLGKPKKQYNQ